MSERQLLTQTINQLLREIHSREAALLVAYDERAWTRARAQGLAMRSALRQLDSAIEQRSRVAA